MGKPESACRSTIRAHSDFKRIYSSKLRLFRNGLTFYYRQAENSNFRFAISISKRFGKAVERNKIRRRLKAIIRTAKSTPENTEIVFCIHCPCSTLTYESLRNACEWVFDKISKSHRLTNKKVDYDDK